MLAGMQGNSSPVSSRQVTSHGRLDDIVRRHLQMGWKAPLHAPTARALEPLLHELTGNLRPLLLDSGCGDGRSTLRLAYRYPDHIVVGLDKSAARLQRLAPGGLLRRGHLWLIRAEVADAWRLLVDAGAQVSQHFLLYPNPWPKPTHVQRRWHAHPVFPWLLALGGRLELRSNWSVYVREFDRALYLAGRHAAIDLVEGDEPLLTPFERKYHESGHTLWRLRCNLQDVVPAPG